MDDFLITFEMAATNIEDNDVVFEPGFAGLQVLLAVHHADLPISLKLFKKHSRLMGGRLRIPLHGMISSCLCAMCILLKTLRRLYWQ